MLMMGAKEPPGVNGGGMLGGIAGGGAGPGDGGTVGGGAGGDVGGGADSADKRVLAGDLPSI
jgi:hypothetical protein